MTETAQIARRSSSADYLCSPIRIYIVGLAPDRWQVFPPDHYPTTYCILFIIHDLSAISIKAAGYKNEYSDSHPTEPGSEVLHTLMRCL